MREKGKVDEGEVPRSVSSGMDAKKHGDFTTPAVIKIPWLLVLCPGLVLSIVPRIEWATPNTNWLHDTLHAINTRCVGGDHSPGVFHMSTRTGEGVANSACFQISRVLD